MQNEVIDRTARDLVGNIIRTLNETDSIVTDYSVHELTHVHTESVTLKISESISVTISKSVTK